MDIRRMDGHACLDPFRASVHVRLTVLMLSPQADIAQKLFGVAVITGELLNV